LLFQMQEQQTLTIGDASSSVLFTPSSIRFALLTSAAYLLLSYVLIGLKTEQLFLVLFFNTMYFASKASRRFILGFSIFIVYWIVFDYMKAFPNYRYNDVHIQSLYEWEKSWFGVNWSGARLTLNEYFAVRHNTPLDLLAGFFYLCWVPVPLGFAAYLFFRNRKVFLQFGLTFFLVNLIGFIGYYLYPAAPPWYVALKGFDFVAHTPGNTAGLGRFDAMLGIPVFAGLYSKSSNVFAAMPSLHAAYMLIVVLFSYRLRMGAMIFVFAAILAGIWFTAVYSNHHYVLDILAGIVCAVTGTWLLRYWVEKTRPGKAFLNGFLHLTSK
jgi:inositol phosphorylceramide synthase catalytic subunit